MNLKYMKVSLFEISYKKKNTFSRHSNLLRCTCIYPSHISKNIEANFQIYVIFNILLKITYRKAMSCWATGHGFPVAQMVEHGASNATIMGSIPRESKSWSNVKTVTWMQCKSLWIKASAKCINVNVNIVYNIYVIFNNMTVRTAERIIGVHLPSLQDLYYSRVKKQAG